MADNEEVEESGSFQKSIERAQLLRQQETARLERLTVDTQQREEEARRQQEAQSKKEE